MHVACHSGHASVISMLLARGMSPDVTDSHGRTPLHNVCKHGQTPCAEVLLAAGASHCADK